MEYELVKREDKKVTEDMSRYTITVDFYENEENKDIIKPERERCSLVFIKGCPKEELLNGLQRCWEQLISRIKNKGE